MEALLHPREHPAFSPRALGRLRSSRALPPSSRDVGTQSSFLNFMKFPRGSLQGWEPTSHPGGPKAPCLWGFLWGLQPVLPFLAGFDLFQCL